MHVSALSDLPAFFDPDIGQYFVTLATKSNMRNSLGDFPAMVLSKLATLMSVRAFNRCGFPVSLFQFNMHVCIFSDCRTVLTLNLLFYIT